MALFASADIAEFAALKSELAYPDAYRLQRKHITATDTRNNRTFTYVTVEAGACRLRNSSLQSSERIIAEKMGWTAPYSVDLSIDTLATPDDRIAIGNRTFDIGAVTREDGFGIDSTAVCEERSH